MRRTHVSRGSGAQAQTSSGAGESICNHAVVRQFVIVSVVWGIVAMAVGVVLAAQLMFRDLT